MIPRPIYYKNKTDFLTSNTDYLEPTCQYYNDIVYIEDTEEIYTHGKIFGDKGVQLNLYDLLTGDTATKQAYYQMLKDQYDKDPNNPVIAYLYGNDGEKDFHLYKRPLLFQYISRIDSFSAPIWQIKTDSDDFEVNYITISSTGEFAQGAKTIVTEDMIYNGLDQITVGWALDATQGKILNDKIVDLIYTLEVTELDTTVTIPDKEFEKISACKGLKLLINGDEYMMFKRTIMADGSITQYENSYIIGANSFKVIITFTNSNKTYYCTKDVVPVQADAADTATDLTGRIETTSEVFTYRPSAGDKSIKDNNAFIRRVKGNSVVFNQIAKEINSANWKAYNSNNASISFNSNIATVTVTNYASDIYGYAAGACLIQNSSIIPNHKYLIAVEVKSDIAMDFGIELNSTYSEIGFVTNEWTYCTKIATSNCNYTNLIIGPRSPYTAELNTYSFRNLICIDLTQMFGTGNEPTTVEEFRALYPDSYYPYSAGELRNLDCSGIKTVGFNQWDEQWEVGGLGTDEYGSPITFDGMIRSTNYNPIFPSTEYYIRTSNSAAYIWYYDSDKKYIGRDINPNSRFFITPTNAAYFKLRIGDTANTITTYNHDICINLHHTGYRDGEYEPYKEVTHALPLSQITNGEPLRKAGEVYDEINETEYIRRVGVVDLGSYDWYETPNGTFNTTISIPDIKAVELESNYMCVKYIGISNPSDIYAGTADNLTISTNGVGRIYIRDDAYKTGTAYAAVPALKASLSGVLLNYELAEPIVTPIEIPIDFNYYVEDFGTEEALLTEDSAPFRADIIYQFNAVDRIRQNDLNIDRLEEKVLALPSEFKTINGNSIIGSGNLTITAGNVGTEDDNDGVDDVNTQTYIRYVEQSLTDDQKTQARTNIGAASISDLASKQDSSTLATVATSGSYNDLSNKPTIPSAVTESTVSGWGFTKNTGTVTGVKINNTTKNPTNGVVDLGTVITEHQDISGKQDELVSGTNIKTINGASLLGSGNLTVAPAYAEYTGNSTAVVVTTKYGYFPTTLVEGASVSVKFEGALTSIATLNVNGTGAKNVYYKGNSLTSGMINQYNTYEFVYDGSYYRIIGINTDTNTHYNAKNIVGANAAATDNATATGSVYLNLIENSSVRSTHSITGTNNISVASDSSGNITISGPELKTINGISIIGSGDLSISGGSNINVVYAESGDIFMQHNTMTIWSPSSNNITVTLTFPIGDVDGQACYNCGLLLTLEGDCSLELDGVEVYWANETAPDMAVDKTYEMWFTSYDGTNRWFGVFTKY